MSEIFETLIPSIIEALKKAESDSLKNNLLGLFIQINWFLLIFKALINLFLSNQDGLQHLIKSDLYIAIKTAILSTNQFIQV